MKRISLLIASFIAVFALNVAFAQAPKHVTWRMTVKMTSATEGTVTLKAVLEPGWHLYGTSLPKGGPKPTVFDMSASKGIVFTSAITPTRTPVKVHDEMFSLDLTWWDTDITFKRNFKVKDKSTADINCKISFMSCNNKTCSPPETVTLTKKL
ncbi:MAG: protein-disulfide reductase DsbD N-terminal domain-containing protein [Muribaculaceae bacterium]|nr:protein-disulfide reductase DsbD N-terminal domain-containing protein [Muribaculaceae bacterium]